jgi:hypothetical protein
MEMYLTREELWNNCKYTEEEFEERVFGSNSPYKLKQSKLIESKSEMRNEYKLTPTKKMPMKSLSDATDSEEEEPILMRGQIDKKSCLQSVKEVQRKRWKMPCHNWMLCYGEIHRYFEETYQC